MPGRLDMDQQGAIESTDLKKDRSKAQEAALPPKPNFAQHHHPTNGSLVNGTPATSNASAPVTNGEPTAATLAVQSPPPQLDQSWRESDANKSMGKLIDRLAQQCFEDLSGQITKMADEAVVPQENGAVSRVDDTAVKKKRGFMEFAQNQRDRFIKTLVLSDWARNAGDDMAKLVDIKVWQEKQSIAQRNAISSIGITKHDLRPAKVPNPNMEGALQVLSTGKSSSKVPDLGYIPSKRLTAKQLLRTLQNMNVTLASRLNLHEDLPPHFNDFSIADGRATFRVPGEFEVDLSLADEELSSPFYFIDIRFLFSPAPGSLDQVVRGQLEMRVNAEMATKGLQGCYAFLHNYVLTHKVNILRDQAQKLLADKWFDCLGVEWKHRVLTLQYWKPQSGKKSWLEFGVGTSKNQAGRSQRSPTPQLTVRWFRKGQLVNDESLDIDWTNLDAERILTAAIAKHATWMLTQTKNGLEKLAGNDSKLEADLSPASADPSECALKLQLPSMQAPMVVRVESVTGWISISPSTERVAANERGLNRDAKADLSRVLAHVLCKTAEDRIGKTAELAGWSILDPRSIKQDNFRTLFGTSFASWKPYVCGSGWNNRWIVLVTYSLSGDKWWIASLEQQQQQDAAPGTPTVRTVTGARRIHTTHPSTASSGISRRSLLQIEKLAAAEVSCAILSQQLTSMHIPHRLEKQAALTFERSSVSIRPTPTIAVFFRGAALLKDSLGKDLAITSIKITHQGLLLQKSVNGEEAEARQEVRLSVNTGKLAHLKESLATRGRDADIAMNESGALGLRLRTPLGQPFVEQILDRLRACERLDHYLTILQHFKFECKTATLHKIAFTYSRSPELSASFTFHGGECSNLDATLRLEPAHSNPHLRTRVMLERIFNNQSLKDRFYILCKSLYYSVGIMQAFEKIESANRSSRALSIHPRHPLLFSIAYKAPLAALTFKVELRERREKQRSIVAWRIKAEKTREEMEAFEAGKSVLELAKQKGRDWWAFEDGTFTALSSSGVAEVLENLDEIMRHSTSTSNGPAKQEVVAKVESKPANGGPKSQQKPAPSAPQPTKLPPQKPNGLPASNGPRTMTVKANASPQPNHAAPTRIPPSKIKQEIIELDDD